MKGGTSPVSEADYAADAFLRDTLLAARPDYGWLSEETADSRGTARARAAPSSSIRSTAPAASSKASAAGASASRWSRPGSRSPACSNARRVRRPFWALARRGRVHERRASARAPTRGRGPRSAGRSRWSTCCRLSGRAGRARIAHIPSLAYRLAMVADGRSTRPSSSRTRMTGTSPPPISSCTRRAAPCSTSMASGRAMPGGDPPRRAGRRQRRAACRACRRHCRAATVDAIIERFQTRAALV